MYSLPPLVLFNEQTGRLELCHAEIARRVRRTEKLRKRYRSMVVRRIAVAAFRTLWRGAVALYRYAAMSRAASPDTSPAR